MTPQAPSLPLERQVLAPPACPHVAAANFEGGFLPRDVQLMRSCPLPSLWNCRLPSEVPSCDCTANSVPDTDLVRSISFVLLPVVTLHKYIVLFLFCCRKLMPKLLKNSMAWRQIYQKIQNLDIFYSISHENNLKDRGTNSRGGVFKHCY